MEQDMGNNANNSAAYRMVYLPGNEGALEGADTQDVAMETDVQSSEWREVDGTNISSNIQGQGCCAVCRTEFQWKKCGFSHHRRDLFYRSQWSWPPVIFLVYRFLSASYLLAWLVYTGVTFPPTISFPWPVWLTNWSFLMLNLHMTLACLIAVTSHDNRGSWCHSSSDPVVSDIRDSRSGSIPQASSAGTGSSNTSSDWIINFADLPDTLPWYIKLDWFLFAIIANISFIVSIVYFAVLFPTLMNIDRTPPLLSDLHLHLLNSIVILLEVALSGIPIRLLHVIYPVIFGFVYIIFSAIYWAFDHNNVLYPNVLDWNKPGTTIIVVLGLALVIVPLIQLMLYGLYRLRMTTYRRVYRVSI